MSQRNGGDSVNNKSVGHKYLLSYDVASGSELTPLVVLQIFGKRNDVHNTVAYIMTKSLPFLCQK